MPQNCNTLLGYSENFGVSSPTTELTKQVMDVTRPNVSFDQMTVDVYNSQEYT